MSAGFNANEEAQLLQTIEMFEVITQSQPLDYQSLEILKEAYFKLGKQKEVVNTSKRIAQAYVQMGQLSSAILEYESVLQLFPDDQDVRQALADIENRASSLSTATPQPEAEPADKPQRPDPVKAASAPTGTAVLTDLDDGRKTMHKLFVEGRFVSEPDFQHCWITPSLQQTPAKASEPFLQLLADKGLVPLEKSLAVVCEKSRLNYLPIEKYDVDVELARSFPKDLCRRWCVLPFDRMCKSVMVATVNPFNKQATHELEQATQQRLLWYLVSPPELVKAINKIFR